MKRHLLSFLPIFLLCVLTSASAQTIHYVKEDGTGDGTSWASASDDLQLMINSSVTGAQIWVAGGTYYPIRKADDLTTVLMDDRNNAFVLKKDVKIYGGFRGINETELNQRDSIGTTNTTILSGDLGTIGESTDYAYHVVISVDDVGTAELTGLALRMEMQMEPVQLYFRYNL